MVIAVAIVLMMEMAIYQIINMVSVRDRFVATARSVHVVGCVAGANVSARATGWIRAGHFQRAAGIIFVPGAGVLERGSSAGVGHAHIGQYCDVHGRAVQVNAAHVPVAEIQLKIGGFKHVVVCTQMQQGGGGKGEKQRLVHGDLFSCRAGLRSCGLVGRFRQQRPAAIRMNSTIETPA